MSRGAPLDLPGAAGVGRIDVVKGFFTEDGDLNARATKAQMLDGFSLACAYGRADVVDFLLDRGIEVDEQLRGHGEAHTGLHLAAFHGQVEVVSALLRRGARTDVIDKSWGTPPLIWALTGWSGKPQVEAGRYHEVVSRLVAAGANVKPDLLDWDKTRVDPKMIDIPSSVSCRCSPRCRAWWRLIQSTPQASSVWLRPSSAWLESVPYFQEAHWRE